MAQRPPLRIGSMLRYRPSVRGIPRSLGVVSLGLAIVGTGDVRRPRGFRFHAVRIRRRASTGGHARLASWLRPFPALHQLQLKHHAMPNYCASDFGDLKHRARRNLRSMQRRSTLMRAFWKQAELF